MKRRSFLKTVAAGAGVVGQSVYAAQPPAAAVAKAEKEVKVAGLPRRVLAIKPMSAGDWPAEMTWDKRPREWWYQTLEDPQDISLALRFTLSQKGVVAGLPPAWPDLAEKAIDAGKDYQPITESEVAKLRDMAQKVGSVFQSGELASRATWHELYGCHGPHEGCPGMMS